MMKKWKRLGHTFESQDEQFPYVAEKNFADSALREIMT